MRKVGCRSIEPFDRTVEISDKSCVKIKARWICWELSAMWKRVSKTCLGAGSFAISIGIVVGSIDAVRAVPQTLEENPKLAQTLPNANTLRPTLRVGSQSPAALELQGVLKLMGYYAGAVDGVYDEETATAVAQFQQATGLSADGIAGIDTWNRLFPPMQAGGLATPVYSSGTTCVCPTPTATTAVPTPMPYTATPTVVAPQPAVASTVELPVLYEGMEGSAVVELQLLLQDLGFYQGSIDGVFGSDTADAVGAAQYNYGLEVDGVVGPDTWNALFGY
ncbi:MAG: peptidoglycan-binding protein [Cyanobacteria bacterium SID2]|nr:peptidoglycan-binding protein [Cyanobacteria bacterium SID2]MBP0003667.1 peptidoglycan-binding protein [Cyanobacteria bacterium SBC]